MTANHDPSTTPPSAASRRRFLGSAALGAAGVTGMLGGCAQNGPQNTGESGGRRRLKAAFSNAGLQSTWCKLGKDTAELWGDLLGVDVVWFDGEFDLQKQRDKIDLHVDDGWDFCCFQAVQLNNLENAAMQLKKRGIPVISMDTLLVERDRMRDVGVVTQVNPDQVYMGETSSRYLFNAIDGRGKVIHIGGLSAHSGAQGRNEGFQRAIADFPNVEVIGGGVRWCDWKKQKARDTFETLLQQSDEPIAGAFFHSDDMALGCIPALEGTIHKDMVITAVDGQKEGLSAVREGTLAATTVNPVCLIHKTALEIGQFIVRNNEAVESLPLEIVTPGPLVSRDSGNLEAMLFLADPRHCMV
ncbi:MAG: substrate-binding domain-containing protein [Pirellulales bacterium]|nr:substrate-binding domain-containing protein [Planctomycetales bacterium]